MARFTSAMIEWSRAKVQEEEFQQNERKEETDR